MRTVTRAISLLVLFVHCGAPALAEQPKSAPLTNDSVVKLVQWKATPGDIISIIKRNKSNTKFSLSHDDVAALSKAGVRANVLDAMWKATVASVTKKSGTPSGSGGTDEAAAGTQTPATPSTQPTAAPSTQPTATPSTQPTAAPSTQPTATPSTQPTATPSPQSTAAPSTQTLTPAEIAKMKEALNAEDPDFALVLGIGSLVVNSGVTDYENQSNVIHSANLGRATPQLLTGISFRSKIPNFRHFSRNCVPDCELWQQRPWSGFVSLKFAPGASQTVNGYVIGGTYPIAHYLNAFIGYALTPVNEPSPGFRTTAAQFVTNEQKQGRDLNFDPNAMLRNSQNAFDGFSVTDSTGKLIYQGNPLTVHYRGGAVFGVSIPVNFKSVFK